jgi:hypothetical protein
MPRESNQTALATYAFTRLARAFVSSQREPHAQTKWQTLEADKEILEQVFDAAWAVIQAHDPFRDLDRDAELQSALRERLFMLAAEGERDPRVLRGLLLAEMPLPQSRLIAS